jgi:alkylation response protein AidB-like acyl-CoA dehydrogenase
LACLDLDLSDQQRLLRDALQRLTASVDRPQWADLCDHIGLAALTLPEAAGGFGGGVADIALTMAELGPALAGADWLPHAAACLVAGDALPDAEEYATGQRRAALICAANGVGLPQVIAQRRIEGTATLVSGAARADLFVLVIEGQRFIVRADHAGVTCTTIAMHDGTHAATVDFAAVSAAAIGPGHVNADAVIQLGRCAEAVGVMHRMLADTADFLNQRHQFGAPIASFQALRHRLADMHLALAQAQALTEAAIGATQDATAIAAACYGVRDAARIVGEGAVQLHGAMGLTEELTLGARFKRLLTIATGLGSEAALVGRLQAA